MTGTIIVKCGKNWAYGKLRQILRYLRTPVVGAVVVLLLDFLALVTVLGPLSVTRMVLVLFLEGGVGLIASTVIALSTTPSVSKFGEVVFGTAQWSREAEKNAERVAGKWIVASAILIGSGFLLSGL